jgi:hypothetical protein
MDGRYGLWGNIGMKGIPASLISYGLKIKVLSSGKSLNW